MHRSGNCMGGVQRRGLCLDKNTHARYTPYTSSLNKSYDQTPGELQTWCIHIHSTTIMHTRESRAKSAVQQPPSRKHEVRPQNPTTNSSHVRAPFPSTSIRSKALTKSSLVAAKKYLPSSAAFRRTAATPTVQIIMCVVVSTHTDTPSFS